MYWALWANPTGIVCRLMARWETYRDIQSWAKIRCQIRCHIQDNWRTFLEGKYGSSLSFPRKWAKLAFGYGRH